MENVSTDSIVRTSSGGKTGKRTEISEKGRKRSTLPFDPLQLFIKESETMWTDSKVMFAVKRKFQVTKEVRVDRVEYLEIFYAPGQFRKYELPSLWIFETMKNFLCARKQAIPS
jgi:hypothetical protein